MPEIFEPDGRGPSMLQLLIRGLAVLLTLTAATGLLLLKSTGRLNSYVKVIADLTNVGDGLPQKSDVKYRGVLVGSVRDVTPATHGSPNFVHIDLKPEYATAIPATVTARVVPSNVFAVSSVQLVDRGTGPQIQPGMHIPEDTQLPTVVFQTTITKLRDLLAASGRGPEDSSLGILAAVGEATRNRRVKLLTAGAQLDRLLNELNAIVATSPGPSTVSALIDAAHGLQSSAPDLLDALHQAIEPMRVFAEKREQLNALVGAGLHIVGTTTEALNNHTDQLIEITTNLGPPLGVLATNDFQYVPILARTKRFSDNLIEHVWDPEHDTPTFRAIIPFTPSYSYTRADCPRYGELKGPSCSTAPEIAVRPDLPEVLLPQNYQPPKNLAPPPGTVIGPDGNLIAKGYPLINPNPNLQDPNPPLPWWTGPAPRVPGTADPDDGPVPTAALPPTAAPAAFGGNVGPVGSTAERRQLEHILGQPASAATQLLLGPVARGTAVSVPPAPTTEEPQ